ncbi:hypothetical protein ABT009_13190 [Streptomyces sp. NPDC002896]|uniref:hypothetical protein n=1 Tax=Streptomyces sp. NPDC002896 TaxID=3154438 RepID=UPI003325902C
MVAHRFRVRSDDDETTYWFETAPDRWPARQVSFAGADRLPVTAASLTELAQTREEFGLLGVQLYEAVYGVLAEGPVEEPPDAEPVTEEEFAHAWRQARWYRHCEAPPYDSGPLPAGTRMIGEIAPTPWPPGVTGLFVGLGLPFDGFIDLPWLPRAAADWPPVGTEVELEVTTLRFDFDEAAASLQIRLRPKAAPPPGEPWPRPVRP